MLALAIALGVAIGLTLGALGAGGSILAVPVLVQVVGLPVSAATATSLVAVGSAAAAGAVGHRSRVQWPIAAAFIATGAVGALGGAAVGRRLDEDVMLLGFSALMLVAAWRMLTACPSCTRVGEERARAEAGPDTHPRFGARRVATAAAAGAGVGFLTGLFGVGGGFIIVPALTLALGLAMPAAIATSLVVVSGNAVVALAIRGPSSVDWPVAVAFTIPMLVGSIAGSRIAHRLDPQKSLNAFAVVLVVVSVANALTVFF